MTTKVTIEACCSDDEEVIVVITEGTKSKEFDTLQNGERREFYIYGNRKITISERKN